MDTLVTWNTDAGMIRVTMDDRENGLGLAIWGDSELAGFNFTEVERAQTLVNELAGEDIWAN